MTNVINFRARQLARDPSYQVFGVEGRDDVLRFVASGSRPHVLGAYAGLNEPSAGLPSAKVLSFPGGEVVRSTALPARYLEWAADDAMVEIIAPALRQDDVANYLERVGFMAA